jgi:predicted ATP-grasp superfamily ATP-dependent carboligase
LQTGGFRVLAAVEQDSVRRLATARLVAPREVLARHFRIYVPGAEAMYTLLNKWRLYEVCVDLGIDVAPTWLSSGAGDLSRVERDARFPVVIKPQTQYCCFLT